MLLKRAIKNEPLRREDGRFYRLQRENRSVRLRYSAGHINYLNRFGRSNVSRLCLRSVVPLKLTSRNYAGSIFIVYLRTRKVFYGCTSV